MNLIDRYVYDVTRRLPDRQREDVGQELRSEIEAMAEDEAHGKQPAKKQVYAVLQRMGNPATLADRYTDRQRYIIGPLYFELYGQVLKTLLLIVVPIIMFLTFTGKLASVNDHIVALLFQSIGVGLEVAVHIFFWVTLSFFLVERYGSKTDISKELWTPDDLPALPGAQQISKTDALVGIAWSALAVWACIMQIPDVHRILSPDVPLFFSPEMWSFWTVALLALSLLSLGVETIKLIIGGWTGLMTSLIVIINVLVLSYFISLVMLVDPVVNPEFTQKVSQVLNQDDVSSSMTTAIQLFAAGIVVVSIYEVFDAVKSYVMAKRRNA